MNINIYVNCVYVWIITCMWTAEPASIHTWIVCMRMSHEFLPVLTVFVLSRAEFTRNCICRCRSRAVVTWLETWVHLESCPITTFELQSHSRQPIMICLYFNFWVSGGVFWVFKIRTFSQSVSGLLSIGFFEYMIRRHAFADLTFSYNNLSRNSIRTGRP